MRNLLLTFLIKLRYINTTSCATIIVQIVVDIFEQLFDNISQGVKHMEDKKQLTDIINNIDNQETVSYLLAFIKTYLEMSEELEELP